MTRRLLSILALLLLAPAALAQSTIELRPSARVAPGETATLEQVATLDGPEAVALADMPVAAPGQASVSLDEVRKALDAKTRVNWGRITLRGSSCSLASGPARAPHNHVQIKIVEPAPVRVEPGTVRAAVVARISQILQAAEDDLKLAFNPEDDQILNLPTAGRTLEIRPIGGSDRIPLAIALYEHDRTIASRTIRVGVQVRRQVPVATAAQRRGDTIDAGEYTTEARWLPPTATPATAEQLAGAAVQGRVAAGQPVMAKDVAPSTVVSKGEIVSVRCISGSLVLTTRGRALSSAKDGELVQLQALDSKRTYFARMDGRGRAIVTAGDPTPDPSARPVLTSLPTSGRHIAPPAFSALEVSR